MKQDNSTATPSLGARVMVIDDSATVRSSLQSVLAALGFEVLCCEDGFDALSKVHSYNPLLVFTDISMPKVDGYETVTLLRASEAFARTPIIMLSSKSGVFDISRGKLIGCDDYLVKPVSPRGVEDIMDRYLPRGL